MENVLLCTHIHSLCGFVKYVYIAVRRKPFSHGYLLLVAAGKILDLLPHARRGNPKVLYKPLRIVVHFPPADKRSCAEP